MKGRPSRLRSPQEKKALSYARDRRNDYEYPHAARVAIPRRKAAENRLSRRGVAQDLGVLPRLDEQEAETREGAALRNQRRVGGWTRHPDASLGDHVRRVLARRRDHERRARGED